MNALRIREAAAQCVDERAMGLVALTRERGLEVVDERLAELRIGFGSADDLVELGSDEGELLRGSPPGLWRGWQGRDQLSQPVFIECAHTLTCPPD